jgi:hypothetical protein
MTLSSQCSERTFLFERDTFTFANDLVWQYRFDPETGAMIHSLSDAPSDYTHRCFVMVRAARQFFYHALFDKTLPPAEPPVYRLLIREVVSRNPRIPCPAKEKITIPGYDCLRSFSRAHAPLLKAECGQAWECYFLRSHWRMVFPVSRAHQEKMARQLVDSMRIRAMPIVHLFLFPRIRINHGVVLFGLTESKSALLFDVYDPNIPDSPATLAFDRSARTFSFPKNFYWGGGPLNLYEIYCGPFF